MKTQILFTVLSLILLSGSLTAADDTNNDSTITNFQSDVVDTFTGSDNGVSQTQVGEEKLMKNKTENPVVKKELKDIEALEKLLKQVDSEIAAIEAAMKQATSEEQRYVDEADLEDYEAYDDVINWELEQLKADVKAMEEETNEEESKEEESKEEESSPEEESKGHEEESNKQEEESNSREEESNNHEEESNNHEEESNNHEEESNNHEEESKNHEEESSKNEESNEEGSIHKGGKKSNKDDEESTADNISDDEIAGANAILFLSLIDDLTD